MMGSGTGIPVKCGGSGTVTKRWVTVLREGQAGPSPNGDNGGAGG
jgi:hypothetical protein